MPSEKCGKIVAEVVFGKQEKVTIVFQDRTELSVHARTFGDFYLYAGKTLTGSEWTALKNAAEAENYKDYLLRLLNRNLYSEKEIADRLKAKKCPEEIARRLIGELKEKKWIDDARYGTLLREEYESKNWGKYKILRGMKEKGLSESIAEKWEFPEEIEAEKAERITEKYCRGNQKSLRQLKASLYAHLIAWGFDQAIAERMAEKAEDYVCPDGDLGLLRNQMEKMSIAHSVDLSDRKEREKWIRKWIQRGFAYRDIEKCMEEIYGKMD